MSDWSDEENDDPVYADRRNFHKANSLTKCSAMCRCQRKSANRAR